MPLQDDEMVGTPTLFTQMLKRAGYRVSKMSMNSVSDERVN